MAVGDIRQRFAHLRAEAGSIGERVKAVLEKAAQEIDDAFGADSHPAQLSIVQHLEQAAAVAVTSPALKAPTPEQDSGTEQQAAGPTSAGTPEPATDQPPQPTSSTSGTSSALSSEGTSSS